MSSLFSEVSTNFGKKPGNLFEEDQGKAPSRYTELKSIIGKKRQDPRFKKEQLDFTADFLEFDGGPSKKQKVEDVEIKEIKKEETAVKLNVEDAYKNALDKMLYFIPPWMSHSSNFCISEMKSKKALDALHWKYHQEIISFMKWAEIESHGPEMALRLSLFERVKYQVHQVFPKAEVVMFGSTASEFALKGSDIDILVLYPAVKFSILCDKI